MNSNICPALFRFDDMIVPGGEDFSKIWNFRQVAGTTYETTESIHPEAKFHWLIEDDAKLRELTATGKRREWARPLRFIWTFVKVRYELGEARPITVGTLRRLIDGTRMDQEKSLTPALNRFLRDYDDDVVFSREMLESFMNGGGDGEDEEEEG